MRSGIENPFFQCLHLPSMKMTCYPIHKYKFCKTIPKHKLLETTLKSTLQFRTTHESSHNNYSIGENKHKQCSRRWSHKEKLAISIVNYKTRLNKLTWCRHQLIQWTKVPSNGRTFHNILYCQYRLVKYDKQKFMLINNTFNFWWFFLSFCFYISLPKGSAWSCLLQKVPQYNANQAN